jgi:hypothetical protein
LVLYLAVADEAVSAVLIREEGKDQFLIYFVSKALQGPELNYQRLEKEAFALLIASRKLRPYFHSTQFWSEPTNQYGRSCSSRIWLEG